MAEMRRRRRKKGRRETTSSSQTKNKTPKRIRSGKIKLPEQKNPEKEKRKGRGRIIPIKNRENIKQKIILPLPFQNKTNYLSGNLNLNPRTRTHAYTHMRERR